MAGDLYNGGKALVTGEAGEALGQRAVDLVESQTGRPFTGTDQQWNDVYWHFAGTLSGMYNVAEGWEKADMRTGEKLGTADAIQRLAFGISSAASLVSGGSSLALGGATFLKAAGLSRLNPSIMIPGIARVAQLTSPLARVTAPLTSLTARMGSALQRITPQVVQNAASTVKAVLNYDLATAAGNYYRF